MSVFGDNLSNAIKKSGISKIKLAQLLNTTSTTIYRWEKGINEAPDDAKRCLATILNVSVAYLMGETDDPTPADKAAPKKQPVMESNVHFEYEEPDVSSDQIIIPVLSPEQTACCGRGIPAVECTYRNEERVQVDRKDVGALCEGKMPFAIIADGDSMEKWGIKDGSRVVINPVEEVHDFDIALVCYKDRLALKKVQRRADGGIILLSSDGAAISVLPDEVGVPAVFSVWGKAMSYEYKERAKVKHGL